MPPCCLHSKSNEPADKLKQRAAMYDVLKLNPWFAPAFIQLAMTTAREGSYINALTRPGKLKNSSLRARLSLVGRKTPSRLGRVDERRSRPPLSRNVGAARITTKRPNYGSALPAEKRPLDTTHLADAALNGHSDFTRNGAVGNVCEGRHRGRRPECGRDKHLSSFSGARMIGYQTRCGSAVITSLSAIISTDAAVVRYKPTPISGLQENGLNGVS